MSRKEALTLLLEFVEEGACRPYVIEEEAARLWDFRVYPLMAKAYDDSLDAAKALHEAVANAFVVTIDRRNDGTWVVTIRLEPRVGTFSGATADSPARAWLIAILKALIAECEE